MEQLTIAPPLTITSSAFCHYEMIPEKYTSDGENINPPLKIEDIPDGTKSLVLFIYDPDAPIGIWDYWTVWNIPPQKDILENSIPGIQGVNSFQQHHYEGPCPASSIHRYFFKVFALDTVLNLHQNSTRLTVRKAMKDHIIAENKIIGFYTR